MKKYVAVFVVVLIIFIAYSTLSSRTTVKHFVRTLSGSEVDIYKGVNGYSGYDYDVPPLHAPKFDLSGFDLKKYVTDNKKDLNPFDFSEQNVYVFIHSRYIGDTTTEQNTIVILNKDSRHVEEYLFPETSVWSTTHITKIGDHLFIHLLHRTDFTKAVQPSDNRYYIFSISQRKFEPMMVDYEDMGNIWYRFYVLQSPDDPNTFAVGYCDKNGFDDCARFAVAISDSHYLKKVLNIKMPFTIGWKNGDLFVKKDSKVYLVDPQEVNLPTGSLSL